ncbi:MAG: SDR family NAD(P)-dependent oxidoreductase [Rhodobacter sp.]|nr:SDR family NAD(P)-dependent oxidoreductase [Rhodobacter sp.]
MHATRDLRLPVLAFRVKLCREAGKLAKGTAMQVALVTGASSGMGKVIAQQLLADGLHVIVAARRIDRMQDLADAGAAVLTLDVADQASIDAAAATIEMRHRGVDVLVNNAGFGLYGALEDVPMADARYQFEVNLFGLAAMTRALLPGMRARGAGRIINISSMGGRMYTPLGGWYHASKHAVEGLSDCLRLELKEFDIDVVVIEPGIIETGFADVLGGPLLKYSGDGAYGEMARNVARSTAANYAPGKGSSPQVIADVVSRAVKARHPKTRYVAGKYARLMIGIRKWLGDRVFDRLISRMAR